MLFDVILPLAFEGVLTYNIPDETALSDTWEGRRVLVQVGRKKVYTGIVWRQHTDPLSDEVEVKDIVAPIDATPMVTSVQLRLWEWMASYYMCTFGEVMKAALPAALRPESETRVRKVAGFESEKPLTATQQRLLDLLADGKEKSVDEIGRIIGMKHVLAALQRLQEAGAVETGERVSDPYRAKTEVRLRLSDACAASEQTLHLMLDALERSPRQQQLMLAFLHYSEGGQPVRRDELLALTGISASVLKGLTDKGLLMQEKHTVGRLKTVECVRPPSPLTAVQQEALRQTEEEWKQHDVVLLHGVTGSGKTELYIHLIKQMLERGEQVLYLVPEIALTTQLTERLRAVFGPQLSVYHSHFTDNERVETYRSLLASGGGRLVLGVRSSVFLPFTALGLVIVDEEHDSSYKQQDPAPRYHARNTAVMLARMTGAKVLLGTATPAVETYYNAQQGKYGLVELTERHGGLQLPAIRLIDTKRQYHRKEMQGHFADPLVSRMADEIGRKKQIIVFQNRRGYAPWTECPACAWVPRCVNCDVSLTLHRRQNVLSCHYCGYTIPVPTVCPACGQAAPCDRGIGTEKAEDELRELFPQARIARMDLDTTRNRSGYQRLIDDFAAHRTDILVGTQMVTKGLHFDDVSTVAVLNADSLVNKPDFRSTETAFQMLEQVSGRAGRTGEQGEVYIQTSCPDNELYRRVALHDYKGLYAKQIVERRDFKYPPFYRLLSVSVKHRDQKKAEAVAAALQAKLQAVFTHRCSRVTEPAVGRLQNMYIRHILLKIEASAPAGKAKELLKEEIRRIRQTADGKSAVIYVDVDPV